MDGPVAPTAERLPCKEKPEGSSPFRPTKHCNKCGLDKPLADFHNSTRSSDGKWAYCKKCSNARALKWYHSNKDSEEYRKFAFRQRLARYGLTEASYADLLASQGGGCAVCGRTEDLGIDHDHRCCPSNRGCCGKCVSGILCPRCNRVLGLLGESVPLVEAL